MNSNHTILFKIRVPRNELGVWFKHPCALDPLYASIRRLNLIPLDIRNGYPDKRLLEDISKFNEVFETGYDKCDYDDLKKLLNRVGDESIKICNNGNSSVYSPHLINDTILTDDLDYVGLNIPDNCAPLRLNYKYKLFDIHCLIAPRFTESKFYLRV